MDTLLICPRCNAFVQPDWPSCKICGFDPSYQGTYESIFPPKPKPVGPGFLQVIGAVVTLVLLLGVFWIMGSFAFNRYEHRDDNQKRQEIVTVER